MQTCAVFSCVTTPDDDLLELFLSHCEASGPSECRVAIAPVLVWCLMVAGWNFFNASGLCSTSSASPRAMRCCLVLPQDVGFYCVRCTLLRNLRPHFLGQRCLAGVGVCRESPQPPTRWECCSVPSLAWLCELRCWSCARCVILILIFL